MMDTILNLGLNDVAVEGSRVRHRQPALRARLVPAAHPDVRRGRRRRRRTALRAGARRPEVGAWRLAGRRPHGRRPSRADRDLRARSTRRRRAARFPQDPREQLRRAYRAVFDSWNAPRAQVYRRANEIADDLGTAVNVVQMVFGNTGDELRHRRRASRATRPPASGGSTASSSSNAQGEDVVAGIRTPEPIEAMRERLPRGVRPARSTTLGTARAALPRHAGHRVHGRGRARSTCCRRAPAKRTATAALRVGRRHGRRRADLPRGGGRADRPGSARPAAPPDDRPERDGRGRRARAERIAGRGVAARSCLDADTAEERGGAGEDVILVRWETTPDDIHGLIQRSGVLTAHGGMTSHAAVVARGMGKPCVAGLRGPLDRRRGAGTVRIGEHELRAGDVITIDGGTGRVIVGAVPPRSRRRSTRTSRRSSSWADDAAPPAACARTPTRRRTPPRRASSARRASASAAPSTCSWARTGCRSCGR